MRELADEERIRRLMRALGDAAHGEGDCYLERGHRQDVEDVREMLARGLVDKAMLRSSFAEIEPELYRFPATDAADFRRSVEELLGS